MFVKERLEEVLLFFKLSLFWICFIYYIQLVYSFTCQLLYLFTRQLNTFNRETILRFIKKNS